LNDRIAAKEYYSIGEVCGITDLKPHVLRYWESQLEIKLIQLLRHLLYREKYTIDGARQKLDQLRKQGKLAKASRLAMDAEMVRDVRREVDSLVEVLGSV